MESPEDRGLPEAVDVIVVGAGASGLWAARELVDDYSVLVLDAGDVGGGASGHAAGFVSGFEDWASYPEALVHSMADFREFDGSHGFEFTERPYVQLAASEAEANRLRSAYSPLFEHDDYRIEYRSAAHLEEHWPGTFELDGFHGGLVTESGGIIDPAAYVDALAIDVEARGADVVTHAPVAAVRAEDGAVTGVEVGSDTRPEGGPVSTDSDRSSSHLGARTAAGSTDSVDADIVICAAGAQTDRLVAPFVDLPVRQFTYSSVRVRAPKSMRLEAHPMAYARDLWWRPEPALPRTLLVSGGTYFLPERDRSPRSPPSEFFEAVRDRLPGLAGGLESVSFVTGSAHTCPTGSAITPDALPVIDAPADAPDGLVVATGVIGGISMSPFTGRAVRSLVTGGPSPVALEPFRADRFGDPTADFDVHDIAPMPDRFPSGRY